VGIISAEEVQLQLSKHKESIYGFFLGNADGIIYKERVFNPTHCPETILKNVVKAICSFAEETDISSQGTIGLSKSRISFIKIKDITYVLSHSITDKEITDNLIAQIANVFEHRSKAKFHSLDPTQLFSGASAVFNDTTDELFREIIIHQQRKILEEQTVKTEAEEVILSDLEIIDFPTSDHAKIEEQTEEKIKESSKEDKLRAITFNILNSLTGIRHLVFIEHQEGEAKVFFEYGNIEEKIVQQTVRICNKYLDEIIKLMNDEDEINAIQVTEKYQIIFVPLNEKNFMYAIATKSIDPVLMEPVFERISRRITNIVLEYKKEKKDQM